MLKKVIKKKIIDYLNNNQQLIELDSKTIQEQLKIDFEKSLEVYGWLTEIEVLNYKRKSLINRTVLKRVEI